MQTPSLTLFDQQLRAAVAPTAHGIRKTGLCKVSGQHLSQAPNDGDLSEQDLREIDAEFAQAKAADPLRQAAADRAQRDEVHALRNAGVL